MISRFFCNKSIYFILLWVVVSVVSSIVAINSFFTYTHTKQELLLQMKENANRTILILTNNVATFIESYAPNEYSKLLQNEMSHSKIFAIVIDDLNMAKIVGKNSYLVGKLRVLEDEVIDYNPIDLAHNSQLENCFYKEQHPIYNESNQTIGAITVYITDDVMQEKLRNIILETILNAFILSVVLIVVLIVMLRLVLLKPIADMAEAIENVDEHGIPKELMQTVGSVEIAKFSHSFNTMLEAVKNSNAVLQSQRQELKTIFDTTKDGIAILDLRTNFIKVNQAYCDITGLNKEYLLKTSCLALTLPEDRVTSEERFKELFEKGFVDNFEKRCVIHDRHIVVNMSLALLPDGEHILASIKDITKFKLFEEQAKLASMGEMIGNIAHQWRQPLSVITTISTGIKLRSDYGQLEGYDVVPDMEMITKQAQYLSKTIDDFRNFIKNSDDKKILSIAKTLEKTLSIVHSAMVNNNITIIQNLQDDIVLEGYENELMQAFINIINNSRDALKANVADDDDRLIFIDGKKVDNRFEFIIKDSGGGIPDDVIHRVFEPYFTTKHQSVGTGIGLSMTYKIITQRHNASIEVTNEEYEYNGKKYKGACFVIGFKVA